MCNQTCQNNEDLHNIISMVEQQNGRQYIVQTDILPVDCSEQQKKK